ncbi:MAG: GNAT family N-acetyltransferase [Oscillospiraceae bacterium]|nr:GNAT family N-acetyltransferase [Oscillospiraceae bacterium]
MQEVLELILPDESWKKQAADYRQAYVDAGESHINGSSGMERYPVYEEWLGEIRAQQHQPATEERTPATTFFAVRKEDGRIIGTIQVRHRLTNDLCRSGGNIGYGVRPDERKRGYAVQMLELALQVCRKIGLERVLLDCQAGNIASERTILRCGGTFAGEAQVPGDDGCPERIRRFWIAL